MRDTIRFLWRWHRLSENSRCCVYRALVQAMKYAEKERGRRWVSEADRLADTQPLIVGLSK